MKLIIAIVRPFKVTEVMDAVASDPDFPGITLLDCRGFGREKAAPHRRASQEALVDFVDRQAILVAVPDHLADKVARRIEAVAHTGQPGDGKLFVVPLNDAVRIATGERGEAALE